MGEQAPAYRELLTQSRLRLFRQCPRKHFIRYTEGYRRVVSAEAMRFGTAFHAGCEVWLKTGYNIYAALVAGREAYEGVTPHTLVQLEAALSGYHGRWKSTEWEVLAVEAEFASEIRCPDCGKVEHDFVLAGKIDAIVKDKAGDVWVVEHKTTRRPFDIGSTYWDKLKLDSQVSIYLDGARALGFDPVGCIYDVARRPSDAKLATPVDKRRYTNAGVLYKNQRETDEPIEDYRTRLEKEAVPAHYRRGEVVRLPKDQDNHERDVWEYMLAIKRGDSMRNTDSCHLYNSPCGYFPVCCGELPLTSDKFEVAPPHSELGEVNK